MQLLVGLLVMAISHANQEISNHSIVLCKDKLSEGDTVRHFTIVHLFSIWILLV